MDPKNPVHRTDDELRDVLDEPGTWVIHGHGDRVFGVGGSLRRALDRAAGFARSGAVVVAVAESRSADTDIHIPRPDRPAD